MAGSVHEKGLDEHVEHPAFDDVEEGHRQSKYKANTQMDDAAKLLQQAGDFSASAQDRKRVLRRIDVFVCIPMCIVYFIQQLDKATLTYAATFVGTVNEEGEEETDWRSSWCGISIQDLGWLEVLPLSVFLFLGKLTDSLRHWEPLSFLCREKEVHRQSRTIVQARFACGTQLIGQWCYFQHLGFSP